jgi:hypothetical protein
MDTGIKPGGGRLSRWALLSLLFSFAPPAQSLAGATEFRVVVYAAKGTAKAGFAKNGLPGTLTISGSTIRFSHLGFGEPAERVAGSDEIAEIKEDSIGWFEIWLKKDESYKFCALTEKNKCEAPVEPIIDALTAALSAATPQEAQPRASEAAPEPPTPHHFASIPLPDGTPATLEQTMRFIQEQLGTLASVRYAAYLQSRIDGTVTTDDMSEEVTNLRARAGDCRIDHHIKRADEHSVGTELDVSTPLMDVREVVVMTAEQYWSTKVPAGANQQYVAWPDPPFFNIVLDMKNGLRNPFPLYDEAMAHRIADALEQAIEFCRSGPSFPSSTSVDLPASTSNYAPLGLGLSGPSQIGTPQDDKAFSEALTSVLSSASDGFASGRVRQRDFPQDRTLTLWETSLRFPGTNGTCLVWVKPTQTYMSCPIRESFYAQPDSRPHFEEVLRALIRILPDDWTVATSGLSGLDQLNRPPDPGTMFINVSFALPLHTEQAFRVTFQPSLGSIDLFIGEGYCSGCSTMKRITELRTALGIGARSAFK